MLSKDAIQELSKAQAITAANEAIGIEAIGALALPDEFTLHDLENYMPSRRRMRGTMTTSVIKDFAAYAKKNAEKGAAVFIDPANMTAIGVLNLGTTENPGHADNLAELGMNRSAAYEALRKVAAGHSIKQSDVAEFLEDWTEIIECHRDGEEIPTAKAIAAVRNITIETLKKLGNEEQQLSATRSTLESVHATSAEIIPTRIVFTCKPYEELEERNFVMRLGIFTGGNVPTINLRIAKLQEHEEQMANELAAQIKELFSDDTLPVALGKYAVK